MHCVCSGVGFFPGALHSMNRIVAFGRRINKSGQPAATPTRNESRKYRPAAALTARFAASSTLPSGVIYPYLHGPPLLLLKLQNRHFSLGRGRNVVSESIGLTLPSHLDFILVNSSRVYSPNS